MITIINHTLCLSQYYYPIILNERGDTIHYLFPPPDSMFVKNQIIINFKPNALYLNKLCYGNNECEADIKDNKTETT
jgi:hypothetical protein